MICENATANVRIVRLDAHDVAAQTAVRSADTTRAQRCCRRLAKVAPERFVFDLFTNSADDHLHNLDYLHTAKRQWRRASAFGLRPFPDKDREPKTSLSENTDAITSIDDLLKHAGFFHLNAV